MSESSSLVKGFRNFCHYRQYGRFIKNLADAIKSGKGRLNSVNEKLWNRYLDSIGRKQPKRFSALRQEFAEDIQRLQAAMDAAMEASRSDTRQPPPPAPTLPADLEARIEAIDWSDLTQAYGDAGGVPNAIRRLMCDNPAHWMNASVCLHEWLCHQQCSVYPATVPAIPLLIDLLKLQQCAARGEILRLLGDIAQVSCSDVEPAIDEDEEDEEDAGPRDARSEAECVVELIAGFPTYVDSLSSSQPDVRYLAPYTLGMLASQRRPGARFPEVGELDWDAVRKRLLERLNVEKKPLIQASVLCGLMHVVDASDDEALTAVAAFSDHAHEGLRLTAASWLAQRDPAAQQAVEFLLEIEARQMDAEFLLNDDRPAADELFHPLSVFYFGQEMLLADAPLGLPSFPWREYVPHMEAQFALARAHHAHWRQVEARISKALDHLEVDVFVGELIDKLLLRIYPKDGGALDESARDEVLRFLYDRPRLFDLYDVSRRVFPRYGLPRWRPRWTVLLGEPQPDPQDPESLAESLATIAGISPGSEVDVEELNLSGLLDGDHYLPLLERFENLEELEMVEAEISDAGIARMTTPLSTLNNLVWNDNSITDAALPHIFRLFPELTKLELRGARITDGGAAQIADAYPSLHRLNLDGTDVGDEALERIAELNGLDVLRVVDTQVTNAGLERFSTRQPHVTLVPYQVSDS